MPFDRMAHSPRLSGFALSAAARLTRSRIGSTALSSLFRKELKVTELRELPDHLRGPFPLDVRPLAGRPPRSAADAGLAPPRPPWSGSSATLAEAYRSGRTTPEEVADRALREARALAARSPAMGPLMAYADDAARSEARASTARWQAGKPIGPLDGVPTAIKEELCVRGFPWTRGTDIGDPSPRADDATVAARVRASGAVILGITPMTEYGLTPTGINPKRTMPRNPHLSACMAGGSSTGAGVAVATGLVPFAIGADGGGSIRTPAALNGIFGIKPTWGRVSRAGGSSGSVAHVGPLASSTLDLARVIDAVSGPDPLDPETRDAPLPGGLERAIGRGVRGLVIGVLEQEFSDASPEIAKAGQMAIDALVKEGARIVSVATPLARYAPAIGYVTIAVEARTILSQEWREHAADLTPDLQLTFATLDALTAPELLDAQRLRAGLRRDIARWFEEVDLLALPTTVATAGRVSDAEMATGVVDTRLLDGLCRFAFLANLTGLPAGSVPVALDREGLPIGFQLVGDAWDEATVLAAMAHLERIEAASVKRPAVAVDRG
ncbi:MAG TPA: amidase [Polyangiaceae bacterium]|nr:amidase [Polyangiaceae bacterium]